MNVVATGVIVGICFAIGVVVGIIAVIAMAAIRAGREPPGPDRGPGPARGPTPPCWPDDDDTDDASMRLLSTPPHDAMPGLKTGCCAGTPPDPGAAATADGTGR